MQRQIDLFIFDLDGTLIDSKEDIAASVNHTLKAIGLRSIPDELIYQYVGTGVTPLIKRSMEAAGEGRFKEALAIFLKHYDEHLLDRTVFFPGVQKILKHFSQKKKVVLTNKPQGFSEKILKGLKADHFFEEILGGDTRFPKKPDPEAVRYLLEKFRADPSKAVMIGDSRVDRETGQNAGILTCGVTYGFRPREELEGSDCLITQPDELLNYFE